MTRELSGVHAKLDRAKEHFDYMDGELGTFGKPDSDRPWATVVKMDREAGKCRIVWRQDEPPPLGWAVRLGEFLYNIRSAMDHLAQLLVLANKGKPSSRTEFPIFRKEGDFKSSSESKTQGMAAEVKAAILDIQPFRTLPHRPTADTLWLIHDLGNKDKHRLLHLADPWLIAGFVDWIGVPDGVITTLQAPQMMRLYDEAVMASYEWSPLRLRITSGKVNMQFQFAVDVALDEGEWLGKEGRVLELMPLGAFMSKCLDYMNATFLPTFTPFLG